MVQAVQKRGRWKVKKSGLVLPSCLALKKNPQLPGFLFVFET
jgi:hypothetical protein